MKAQVFSLTPGFSPVFKEPQFSSRFNGFPHTPYFHFFSRSAGA
jgi:hypothetical protein